MTDTDGTTVTHASGHVPKGTDDDGMVSWLLDVAESDAVATAPPRAAEQTSFGRWLAETVLLVLAAFLIAQGIKTFIVQPFVIPTGSMIPTIEISDRVIAEKLTYRFRDPRPGEIVVFQDPSGQYPQLIKRVIAVEGQTVEIQPDGVHVDGVLLDEPYVHGLPTDPGRVPTPIVIPEGQMWVMGDNRPNSGDSRFTGPQPFSSVKGRAIVTYWPLSRIGTLD